MTHSEIYLSEVSQIAQNLPVEQIEALVDELVQLRERGGRLFLVGLGGSLANCQHAVNDFRRLCGIDAFTVDNLAELTARANDDGWGRLFNRQDFDTLFVLSVGGGTLDVSLPITNIASYADIMKKPILGIVGRKDGYACTVGTNVLVVPAVHADRITPHTEAFQMVILHLLFSHPKLQTRKTVW